MSWSATSAAAESAFAEAAAAIKAGAVSALVSGTTNSRVNRTGAADMERMVALSDVVMTVASRTRSWSPAERRYGSLGRQLYSIDLIATPRFGEGFL